MNIIFNIYRLSLENKNKEHQVLSRFNGETDFLNVLEEFCSNLFQNVHRYIDDNGRKRSFSLSFPEKKNEELRAIWGTFEPAFSGDKFNVKDNDTNSLKYSASSRDLQSREIFALIHVPKNSEYAYLCVQRKANYSIKTVFQNTLNSFLKKSGYLDFNLKIENATNQRFLLNMIMHGDLKEVRLIKENPLIIDDIKYSFALDKIRVDQNEQVLKFSKGTNTEMFKQKLLDAFVEEYSEFQKISFLNKVDEYDEITFVMNSRGLTKTFYVKDKSKIKSSLDVSNLVGIQNDEIIIEDLVNVSLECIKDIINSRLNNFNDVA